jgi:hypothetical protein
MKKKQPESLHRIRLMNRLETVTVVNEDHPYMGPTGALFIRDDAPDPMNFTGKRKDQENE